MLICPPTGGNRRTGGNFPTVNRHPCLYRRVTDCELVERARAGDQTAFGDLVDRHRDAVFRAALAALGNREEAEDVAQEAFVAAYRGLDGFRGDATFKTWVTTIAWRRALNRRRGLGGPTASSQVLLSIAVGIAAVFGAIWVAAKVFRVGLLMHGKPPNLATLFRWVRMA